MTLEEFAEHLQAVRARYAGETIYSEPVVLLRDLEELVAILLNKRNPAGM